MPHALIIDKTCSYFKQKIVNSTLAKDCDYLVHRHMIKTYVLYLQFNFSKNIYKPHFSMFQ
jgi:ribosomal protein S3AE